MRTMAASYSSLPLPSDIIFEILTRTSLKTLDTSKAVSKEWNDLIFESSFMPQFCERSQNISGCFVQALSRTKHVTEFVSMDGCSGNSTKAPFHLPIDDIVKPRDNFCNYYFDVKIEASSKQGILCCVRISKNEYRYHVCKPSTKQWMKLPNPRTRYSTVKVALIVLKSNPLRFKIIRLSKPRTLYHHYRKLDLNYYRCEVFDSEGWEWRQGKDLLVPQGFYFDKRTPAVNASGLVYFKLRDDQVMALNYNGEEAFPRFSLPNPAFEYNDYQYNQLVEYNGKLGLTCLSPKGMELWVFENGRQVWELKKEVDIETIKGVTQFPTPVGFYNADIALTKDYYEVIFYKLQDKSFNVVKLDKCHTVQEIFPFRSDLEPLDLSMQRANADVSSTKHLYRPFWILLVIVFVLLFGIFVFSCMKRLL
ncbi:putative F-box protein At1g12855 [Lycium barbarum]|uniref:putative F-box protein At1g12855 n=1 Tax=Lycium barbarum TaxID=112863 RepID=UPI00293F3873|nr:putative F-box protein At1g12855 [Lycium barbarum]